MENQLSAADSEINERIIELANFSLDVYTDIFSSEYVYDVIYNHPERIQKIQPILDRLGFIRSTHFVFTVIFDNFWRICEGKANTYRYQLKRILLNQTRAVLARIHPACVAATLIGTDKVVVLLECAGMDQAQAERYSYQCAESLRDGIMRQTTFSVSIGVSRYCSSPSAAWRAYEQSFQALSSSFTLGYAHVLKYRQKENGEQISGLSEISGIAKQFALAVSSRDAQLCCKNTDALFRRLSVVTSDENYVKSYVVLVLSEVIQYCIRLGMDTKELSQRLMEMIRNAFQAGTITKLQELTNSFLLETIGAKDNSDLFRKERIHIGRAYIEQFHTEPLSLQDLSQLCGYSDAYFCRLFKKTFGKTYTAYLADCRIEHAKQLLEENKKSISAISEAVGFQSFSHFCICFRKLVGKTPSEYRKERISRDASPG